jgi:pyridinium-3,5-bisthiocarboxylic acid mononucleotide nickel chelatase
MTKIAYLECQTGIAGDMCLGALVDLGVPLDYLTTQLDRLQIQSEYKLRAEKIHHNGQIATKVSVDLTAIKSAKSHHGHPHAHEHGHEQQHSHEHHHDHHYDTPQRNLPQIAELINGAQLPSRAAQWSLDIFRQLAVAEGAVHGIAPSEVHFHEVGAVDAIIDIVGTCLGLDYLEIDKIYCSALPTGGGTVRAAHGILPVPVPAVLKLWSSRQVPVYSNGIDRELVTPTGAAIAVTLATEFGSAPAMQLEAIGLGAGTISLPIPNILRMWIGTIVGTSPVDRVRAECLETIQVLTTQIDDLNPQAIGYVFDRLFQAGAVDVFTQPIGMKKSRPGILLTVICPIDRTIECEQIIFCETSTLGIRRDLQTRSILPRVMETVTTKYGEIRVKVAHNNLVGDDQLLNIQPEYADCAAIAVRLQVPWKDIYQSALTAWHHHQSTKPD